MINKILEEIKSIMTPLWFLLFTTLITALILVSSVHSLQQNPDFTLTLEPEEEDDEVDSAEEERQDKRQRIKLANRLGLKNFSSAAIADKASDIVVAHILRRVPTTPRRRFSYRKNPFATSTTTSTSTTTTSPSSPRSRPRRSRRTKAPIRMNLTDKFEFRFPDEVRQGLNASEVESLNNIEAAILEALHVAQRMALEKEKSALNNVSVTVELEEMSKTPETPPPSSPPSPPPLPPPPSKRRTRRPRPGPTTRNPNDPLGILNLAEWARGFVQEGNAIGWAWKNAMRLLNTPQVEYAVEVVECQVFYNCDVSNELGSNVVSG